MKNLIFTIIVVVATSVSVFAQDTQVNLKDYGGRSTLGIALGGGGIIGVPFRLYFSEKAALEIAAFYRPIIVIGGDGGNAGGPMFTGGFDFFMSKRYVESSNKIKLNGLFVKGGYGFSELVNTSMVGFGWAHEMFHKSNKSYSFNFELGPGVLFNQLNSSAYAADAVQFALYWKCHWSWALKPGF